VNAVAESSEVVRAEAERTAAHLLLHVCARVHLGVGECTHQKRAGATVGVYRAQKKCKSTLGAVRHAQTYSHVLDTRQKQKD